ncbi:MAG: manganese efflux pump MntP family protein [Coriobacteriia bacterium]|nr:manganese efflux pump MntP family protein [Coriobacteriia bacterium]
MSALELLLVAIGVSMDAFAVSVSAGLSTSEARFKKAFGIGAYFGLFQGLMPVIGYLVASYFADLITSFDHWVALALLVFLGIKSMLGTRKNEGCPDRECPEGVCNDRQCPQGAKPEKLQISLHPRVMLPLAIATSIDALAVGVSFAFLRISIYLPVCFIGLTTWVLSMVGFKVGSSIGRRFAARAEFLGGLILILIGLKILLDHTVFS